MSFLPRSEIPDFSLVESSSLWNWVINCRHFTKMSFMVFKIFKNKMTAKMNKLWSNFLGETFWTWFRWQKANLFRWCFSHIKKGLLILPLWDINILLAGGVYEVKSQHWGDFGINPAVCMFIRIGPLLNPSFYANYVMQCSSWWGIMTPWHTDQKNKNAWKSVLCSIRW